MKKGRKVQWELLRRQMPRTSKVDGGLGNKTWRRKTNDDDRVDSILAQQYDNKYYSR